jgi:hypothetical protein
MNLKPGRWALAALLGSTLALAASAAPALASGTGSTGSTGTTGSGTPPALAGRVTLTLPGLFNVHGDLVTVPRRSTALHGRVVPYVRGQRVRLRFRVGAHLWRTQRLAVKRSADGRFGWFKTRYGVPRVGHVTISALHVATAAQRAFSTTRAYNVLSSAVGPGASGRFVQLLQQRLARLHFYLPQSGVYDLQTKLAVNAYHRLLGRGHSPLLDLPTVTDLLNGVGRFHVRFRDHGRHAEGDLTHQILALVDGSKVRLLFPISSGKPSTPTILGSYHIYLRVPGYLPDGMYYSNFFIRGYAIHGYDPAPDYPASHGCMRLPITDAITAYDWLALGDWVDVYYR